MRILITSPLRQDPKIFQEHREALERLHLPEGVSVDYFWVVNNCPEVIPLLADGEYVVADTPDMTYGKDEIDHKWSMDNMFFMSKLRTMCMHHALFYGYDQVLFVDTDIILQPDTLDWLIAADKDIVCECMWTRTPSGDMWANAWDFDQIGLCSDSYETWKTPGLYRVGMAGAITLIKRKVIAAGATYERIPNIMTALRGEDRHFCIRAACLGFEIWLDTHAPALHLYRESEYQDYMRKKEC